MTQLDTNIENIDNPVIDDDQTVLPDGQVGVETDPEYTDDVDGDDLPDDQVPEPPPGQIDGGEVEEDDLPETDPQIAQVRAEMAQMQQLHQQQMQQQQQQFQMQMQQTMQQQNQAQGQRYQGPRINEDLDSMTPQESGQLILERSLQESGAAASRQLQSMNAHYGNRLGVMGEVLNILIEGHPEKANIEAALQTVNQTPGMAFPQALKTARGLAALQENEKFKKAEAGQRQQTRKRSKKAKQQSSRTRSNQKVATETEYGSTQDAALAAYNEIKGRGKTPT